MTSTAEYQENKILLEWLIVNSSCQSYLKSKSIAINPSLKIPKIVHHIWLGSPLPEEYRILRKTWMKYHPDWKFILWTDKEIESLNLKNKFLYEIAQNYGEKSDIARYEIIYRFGGLYIDTDFECLRPFDEFHFNCNFYTGVLHAEKVQINNALIAAEPHHPILKHCINKLHSYQDEKVYCSNDTMHRTGPYFFTKAILECSFNNPEYLAVIFPIEYFYPLPSYRREALNPRKWITPESYAIHYWDTAWMKPTKKENILTVS